MSKTLWATHIRFLNDESEVRYSRDLLSQMAERLRPEYSGDWAAGVVLSEAMQWQPSPDSETSPDTFVESLWMAETTLVSGVVMAHKVSG